LDSQSLACCGPIDLFQFGAKYAFVGNFVVGSELRVCGCIFLVYVLKPNDSMCKVFHKKFIDEKFMSVLQESIEISPISAGSLDLAMSFGLLNPIPNNGLAIKDVASKIESGRVFLCNLNDKLEKPLFLRSYSGL
jgi:hypothetical protein